MSDAELIARIKQRKRCNPFADAWHKQAIAHGCDTVLHALEILYGPTFCLGATPADGNFLLAYKLASPHGIEFIEQVYGKADDQIVERLRAFVNDIVAEYWIGAELIEPIFDVLADNLCSGPEFWNKLHELRKLARADILHREINRVGRRWVCMQELPQPIAEEILLFL